MGNRQKMIETFENFIEIAISETGTLNRRKSATFDQGGCGVDYTGSPKMGDDCSEAVVVYF